MVGGGCGLGGSWVGRGGERHSEEEEEGRACSGSGMASVLEDGFRAPEGAWSLRDRKEREIKDGRKGMQQCNEA